MLGPRARESDAGTRGQRRNGMAETCNRANLSLSSITSEPSCLSEGRGELSTPPSLSCGCQLPAGLCPQRQDRLSAAWTWGDSLPSCGVCGPEPPKEEPLSTWTEPGPGQRGGGVQAPPSVGALPAGGWIACRSVLLRWHLSPRGSLLQDVTSRPPLDQCSEGTSAGPHL